MAEAYGLWQGIKLLRKNGVDEVLVFGDSRLLIQALIRGCKGKNERNVRLINRIRAKAKLFRSIKFYHILRELNVLADLAANKSMVVGINELIVNSTVSKDIPP